MPKAHSITEALGAGWTGNNSSPIGEWAHRNQHSQHKRYSSILREPSPQTDINRAHLPQDLNRNFNYSDRLPNTNDIDPKRIRRTPASPQYMPIVPGGNNMRPPPIPRPLYSHVPEEYESIDPANEPGSSSDDDNGQSEDETALNRELYENRPLIVKIKIPPRMQRKLRGGMTPEQHRARRAALGREEPPPRPASPLSEELAGASRMYDIPPHQHVGDVPMDVTDADLLDDNAQVEEEEVYDPGQPQLRKSPRKTPVRPVSGATSPLVPKGASSFRGHRCPVEGCVFGASTPQQVQHHLRSSQHGRVNPPYVRQVQED